MGFLPTFAALPFTDKWIRCPLPLLTPLLLGAGGRFFPARAHTARQSRYKHSLSLFFGVVSGKKEKSTLIGSRNTPPSDPHNRCWVKPKLPCYIPQ